MGNINTNKPEKVYMRIRQQEKFIETVAKVADEEGINENLINEVKERFGNFEDLGLEETLKKMSQYGWLDRNLEIVEKRFAYVVKSVIDADESQLVNLENAFYELGQEVETDYEGKPIK